MGGLNLCWLFIRFFISLVNIFLQIKYHIKEISYFKIYFNGNFESTILKGFNDSFFILSVSGPDKLFTIKNFWFINIKNKESSYFIVFDTESFYLSISEDLFKSAIQFAKESVDISDYNFSLINQAWKTILLNGNTIRTMRILISLWVVLISKEANLMMVSRP